VNLTGSFLGIKNLAPLMPKGGSIVSISSTVGLTGYFSAAYSTSKWALRGLTKSAAMELASLGVRVNCICPGVVDTEMIRNNQKLFDALQTITPMGHMAQADQLADAMFFLLGPQSAYITGVDLAVDGGLTSGGIFWPVGRAMGAL
jgi:NAD(P)-dependent dehydrogenase (short-subunit alcohol dehydrogenase family)